jgi:hypothetical protein
MGTVPFALRIELAPAQIDPANDGTGPIASGVGTVPALAPILYQGVLYKVLNSPGFLGAAGGLTVFRSYDGQTWSPQDQQNGPPATANASCYFDGDHTIVAASSLDTHGNTALIELRNFDLSTNTWGPSYGLGASGDPSTQLVCCVIPWTAGSVMVLHVVNESGAGPTVLSASVFNGATWSTFDAGAAIAGEPGYNSATDVVDWSAACVDPATGKAYVFIHVSGGSGTPDWGDRYFFQLILPNNTFGSFLDFPGFDNSMIPPPFTLIEAAMPIIVGDSVTIGAISANGATFDYPAIVYGTPLAAPVFTQTGSIDPQSSNSLQATNNVVPFLAFDGQTLYALYGAGASGQFLRLCYNNIPPNLLADGWASIEVIDYTTVEIPSGGGTMTLAQRPAIGLAGNLLFLSADFEDFFMTGFASGYFIGFVGVTKSVQITFRGAKLKPIGKREICCEAPELPHIKRAV